MIDITVISKGHLYHPSKIHLRTSWVPLPARPKTWRWPKKSLKAPAAFRTNGRDAPWKLVDERWIRWEAVRDGWKILKLAIPCYTYSIQYVIIYDLVWDDEMSPLRTIWVNYFHKPIGHSDVVRKWNYMPHERHARQAPFALIIV